MWPTLAKSDLRHIFFDSITLLETQTLLTRNPSVDVCQRLDHPRNTLSTIPMAPIRPEYAATDPDAAGFGSTLEDSVSSLSGSNSLAEPVSSPDLIPELMDSTYDGVVMGMTSSGIQFLLEAQSASSLRVDARPAGSLRVEARHC